MANQRPVIQADDPQGPAAMRLGDEGLSDAGARRPSDDDRGARATKNTRQLIREDDEGALHVETQQLRGGVLARDGQLDGSQHEVPSSSGLRDAPHGFSWLGEGDKLRLVGTSWFIAQVSGESDAIFSDIREKFGEDQETRDLITEISCALGSYLNSRGKLNPMVEQRKLQQEMDDACYQLCQAAKFYLDALERAQSRTNRGEDISNDQRIQSLSEYSQKSAYEGYVLAAAVAATSPNAIKMNFNTAAKRVVDYSARKLTEWYAANQRNHRDGPEQSNNATVMAIMNMYRKKS